MFNTKPGWEIAPTKASLIVMAKVAGVPVYAFAERNEADVLVLSSDRTIPIKAPWRGVEERPGTGNTERIRGELDQADIPDEIREGVNALINKLGKDTEVVLVNGKTGERTTVSGNESECDCEQCQQNVVTLKRNLIFRHAELGLTAVLDVIGDGSHAVLGYDFQHTDDLDEGNHETKIVPVEMSLDLMEEISDEEAIAIGMHPGRESPDSDIDSFKKDLVKKSLPKLYEMKAYMEKTGKGGEALTTLNATIELGEKILKG